VAVVRYNPDGSQDATFGASGVVTTSTGTTSDQGMGVAIQTDNKIVVVSRSKVMRYNPDGTLDVGFGAGGMATATGFNKAVVIQPDNKIVVVGSGRIVRLNLDGSLDGAFGSSGMTTTPIAINGLALQSDHKIVVAGYSQTPEDTYVFAVARYSENGTLDTTFSGDGKVTTAIGPSWDWVYSVAIQADGKIVVAGISNTRVTGYDYDVAVVRYNSDGSLDISFGGDGTITTPFSADGNDWGHGVAIQENQKILVAGFTDRAPTGEGSYIVGRYNPDGTLDSGLSGDGKAYGPKHGAFAYAMALQADGKIIVAGNGGFDFLDVMVVRFEGDVMRDIFLPLLQREN